MIIALSRARPHGPDRVADRMSVRLVIVGGMLSVFTAPHTSLCTNRCLHSADDQRLALMMLTNTIQGAGYSRIPHLDIGTGAPPRIPRSPMPGKGVAGTTGAAAPGDSLIVRYEAGTADGTMDCTAAATPRRQPDAGQHVQRRRGRQPAVFGQWVAAAQALAASVQNFQSSTASTRPPTLGRSLHRR